MRNYKRKSGRRQTSAEVLWQAAREVKLGNMSVRSVAQNFNIHYKTLGRVCSKVTLDDICHGSLSKVRIGYAKVNQVFTDDQEQVLEEHLAAADHGMTQMEVRRLAWTYAESLGIKTPKSWLQNQAAGYEWFGQFMKRHPNLTTCQVQTSEEDDNNFDKIFKMVEKAGEEDSLNADDHASSNTTAEEAELPQPCLVKVEQLELQEVEEVAEDMEGDSQAESDVEDHEINDPLEMTCEQPEKDTCSSFPFTTQYVEKETLYNHDLKDLKSVVSRLESVSDKLALAAFGDAFDEFGKYIASLLRGLPRETILSLKQQIVDSVLRVKMAQDQVVTYNNPVTFLLPFNPLPQATLLPVVTPGNTSVSLNSTIPVNSGNLNNTSVPLNTTIPINSGNLNNTSVSLNSTIPINSGNLNNTSVPLNRTIPVNSGNSNLCSQPQSKYVAATSTVTTNFSSAVVKNHSNIQTLGHESLVPTGISPSVSLATVVAPHLPTSSHSSTAPVLSAAAQSAAYTYTRGAGGSCPIRSKAGTSSMNVTRTDPKTDSSAQTTRGSPRKGCKRKKTVSDSPESCPPKSKREAPEKCLLKEANLSTENKTNMDLGEEFQIDVEEGDELADFKEDKYQAFDQFPEVKQEPPDEVEISDTVAAGFTTSSPGKSRTVSSFSCHLCSSSYTTNKELKSHYTECHLGTATTSGLSSGPS